MKYSTRYISGAISGACMVLFIVFINKANGGSVSSELNVSVTVSATLDFQIKRDQSEIKIKKKDLKKGRKKIKNGTVILIKTNSVDGYIIQIQVMDSPFFTSVKVQIGQGPQHELLPGDIQEIHIPYSGKKKEKKKLSYKFQLSSDATTGKYSWPILVIAYVL